MALIRDLEQFPSGALARETRKLVDLALTMTGRAADNSGITSNEDGDPDVRPLQDGGYEAWKFVRRARDNCWEKAGLDPAVFNCPEDANDISFPFSSEHLTGSSVLPGNMSQDNTQDNMLGIGPVIGDDWSFWGFVTDPVWDIEQVQDFDFENQASYD